MKICSGKNSCSEEKSLTEFYFNNQKNIYNNLCISCVRKRGLKQRETKKALDPDAYRDHQRKLKAKRKENDPNFVEKQRLEDKNRRDAKKTKNPEALKQHEKQIRENKRARNPDLYLAKKREYEQKRLQKLKKENPEKLKEIMRKASEKLRKNTIYSLKMGISGSIFKKLKLINKSKNQESCLKYLNYSLKELKEHLESLFEPWMNWDNRGQYIVSKWNDNDPTTWKWHLDHIIPHSTFNYDSMEHPDFQKCWALENLRPYSAKQNVLDGTQKIRHKEDK